MPKIVFVARFFTAVCQVECSHVEIQIGILQITLVMLHQSNMALIEEESWRQQNRE